MLRSLLALAVMSLLTATPAEPAAAGSVRSPGAPGSQRALRPQRPVTYMAPVPGAVVRGFDPPQTQFGAGHRGVDFAAAPGATVRAAADGVVTYAANLAGRGVIVVQHADGIRTEYEPVRPAVRVAAQVARGSVLGYVQGQHVGCAPGACLHWGARRGAIYLDPLSLLGGLGVVRLVPWSAAPR